jgi:hypothetical protein
MQFSDPYKMFAHLEKMINSTLKQEVASEAVETMQEHVQSDVYDPYSPVMYERQGYDGGLIDRDNIEVEIKSDNTISIENIRFDGDREVAQIIESGSGYTYDFEFNGVPRPFTENTRKELESSNRLQLEMAKGLRKRGLDVK